MVRKRNEIQITVVVSSEERKLLNDEAAKSGTSANRLARYRLGLDKTLKLKAPRKVRQATLKTQEEVAQ